MFPSKEKKKQTKNVFFFVCLHNRRYSKFTIDRGTQTFIKETPKTDVAVNTEESATERASHEDVAVKFTVCGSLSMSGRVSSP